MDSIYHKKSIFLEGRWIRLDLGLSHTGDYRVQLGGVLDLMIGLEPTIKKAESKLFAYAEKMGFTEQLKTIERKERNERSKHRRIQGATSRKTK
jgi:hypothetical protein